MGQAFVGPTTLPLRTDLSTKAPVSATVRHGEPLEIIEYKRRFLKVRTAGGIVGWTDIRQLLTPEQMADLRRLSEQAGKFPSQGTASTFEVLNVHTEPNRISPSFIQIPEGSKVDVIGHKITPRTQAAPPTPAPPPRQRAPRRKSKEKQSAKIPPPPMPPGPKLPANWRELSRTPQASAAETTKPAPPAAPVPMDDWELIRTKDGRVGWALSRMVTMAIPDDVAQYAEGHRITSYFQMGEVQDEDQVKHNWLWTTVGKGPQPYEFDSFRFFIWSKHHHRYETAYIQREVVGHYPVEVNTSGPTPTFTLIVEGDNGGLFKKTYAFNGSRVNLASTTPYELPKVLTDPPHPSLTAPATAAEAKPEGWFARLKSSAGKLFHR